MAQPEDSAATNGVPNGTEKLHRPSVILENQVLTDEDTPSDPLTTSARLGKTPNTRKHTKRGQVKKARMSNAQEMVREKMVSCR